MRKILLPLVMALAASAGCYTQGDVGYSAGYSGGYGYAGPEMYYYSPGVSIVAYADDPVFYSDNFYWRYYDGGWYRSSSWNGGWSAAYDVPYGVRGIDRPYSYAHFTPGQGWTRVGGGGGGYAGAPGGVRDHRTGGGGYYPARTYQAPEARDHRAYSPSPQPTYTAPARSAPMRSGPVVRDHRR